MRLIDADILKQHIDKLPALPDGNFAGTHRSLKALINMQPTIKSGPHWIPCSERLPRVGQDVLVTFYCEYYVGERRIVKKGITITHRNGNKSFSQFLDGEVVAWMELPKAYKGGKE